ncbi:hypothetical protein MHM582_2061 [Microbacterium sp. HM58-2]|nr:hypothetical protein MHM582_2061 [Microbacterium sp. HM58-2]
MDGTQEALRPVVIDDVSDRCDECGQKAFLFASHPSWPASLAWCAHHGTEKIDGLMRVNATIADHRDQVPR